MLYLKSITTWGFNWDFWIEIISACYPGIFSILNPRNPSILYSKFPGIAFSRNYSILLKIIDEFRFLSRIILQFLYEGVGDSQ